ncbi:amidohydrolase family protein [Flagellimonas meishanensis]|uniref:amidohydrolase family protein n=1 Tax=Flagellimonas meishanensis TaxID=2873264 RepID=UPI001CA6FB98|nr:amidohydrolase family protein [[Muricauda] meishanensis]
MMRHFLLPFFILCFSCSSNHDLLITNVSVINIETGKVTVSDIVIKDSIIVKIAEPGTIANNAETHIDGSNNYMIPALWDMHVHIQDSSYLRLFLDHGVTGVRDMGGCVHKPTDGCESLCAEYLNQWKSDMRLGKMRGPRLFIAGYLLSGTGWPTSLSVSNKEEVAVAFQQNLEDQVDFIKVYEKIPWESYKEIARLSKLHGLDFVGHVSEPFLLSDILDLGQKSIEHIREPLLYSFTKDSLELEQFMMADGYSEEDRKIVQPWLHDSERVVEAFKRNQAWITPTMAVQYARLRYNDEPWISHPIRDQLPESVNQGMHAHMESMSASMDKKGDSLWWMALTKLVKRFSMEEIGLLAGSDTACEGGLPGYSLHEELFLMVEEAGLSPLEALQTATVNPCRFFNLKKHGKIAEGYYADLVLLTNNPLSNIRNTLAIKAVIQNGNVERFN